MVEGKAMMLKFLNVTPNLLESLADVIPHCAKVAEVVLSIVSGVCLLPSLSNLRVPPHIY